MVSAKVRIFIATLAMFSSTYCLSNVFPYVGFMVVHFYPESTKEEAGYRAGLLASSFMFARIPASVVWGFLADKIGRKPVLLLGCSTLFVFQFLFGFSPSFEFAVFCRLLMGLFSGVVGTSKTVASEIAGNSAQEQGQAMNFITGASNLGVILGPAFSGLLYDPVNQYPGTFLARLPLMEKFPFLLPNIMSSFFALVSGLLIVFCLPETLPEAKPISEFIGCTSTRSPKYFVVSPDVAVPSGKEEEEEDDEVELEEGQAENDNNEIEKGEKDEKSKVPEAEAIGFRQFLKTIGQLWGQPRIRIACKVYAYYSFVSIFFSELFPLWLLSKREVGGFGFDAKTIGMSISASGGILLLFQGVGYSRVANLFQPVTYCTINLLISAAFYLQLPMTSLLPYDDTMILFIVITVQRGLQNILNLMVFNQSNVMVNNSCIVSERGTVNGITMGLGSIYKAIGPLCAGFVYAWSINNDMLFPFNYFLSFLLMGALCIALALYCHLLLPKELNSQIQNK